MVATTHTNMNRHPSTLDEVDLSFLNDSQQWKTQSSLDYVVWDGMKLTQPNVTSSGETLFEGLDDNQLEAATSFDGAVGTYPAVDTSRMRILDDVQHNLLDKDDRSAGSSQHVGPESPGHQTAQQHLSDSADTPVVDHELVHHVAKVSPEPSQDSETGALAAHHIAVLEHLHQQPRSHIEFVDLTGDNKPPEAPSNEPITVLKAEDQQVHDVGQQHVMPRFAIAQEVSLANLESIHSGPL